MDNKAIIEKALKGEDYQADIKEYTDEQKTTLAIELRDAAAVAAKVELDKVSALRKEGKRLEDKPAEGTPPPPPAVDPVTTQFRDEQMSQAESTFFSDPQFSKLSEDDKTAIKAEFKNLHKGEVSADANLKVFRKAYALVKSDDLISAREKVSQFENNAQQYQANAAMVDATGNSTESDKYSPATKALFREWQKAGYRDKTLDQAKAVVEGGMSRNL